MPTIPAFICQSAELPELGKFTFATMYRGERREAIAVRFKGAVYGYLNECTHMAKPLDCEHHEIFDESGRYLRCSVHGICYDPVTGDCLGGLCDGRKLTPLRVKEEDGGVYLIDKKAALAD